MDSLQGIRRLPYAVLLTSSCVIATHRVNGGLVRRIPHIAVRRNTPLPVRGDPLVRQFLFGIADTVVVPARANPVAKENRSRCLR